MSIIDHHIIMFTIYGETKFLARQKSVSLLSVRPLAVCREQYEPHASAYTNKRDLQPIFIFYFLMYNIYTRGTTNHIYNIRMILTRRFPLLCSTDRSAGKNPFSHYTPGVSDRR